jgi:hypothetical protein
MTGDFNIDMIVMNTSSMLEPDPVPGFSNSGNHHIDATSHDLLDLSRLYSKEGMANDMVTPVIVYVLALLCSFVVIMMLHKGVKYIVSVVKKDDTFDNTDGMATHWLIVSAIVTSYLGISSAITYGIPFIQPSHDEIVRTINITSVFTNIVIIVGYFIYGATVNKLGKLQIIHHLLGSVPPTLILFSGDYISMYLADSLMTLELSTIFLNLKNIVPKSGKFLMTVIFSLVFLLVRPIPLLSSVYRSCTVYDSQWWLRFMSLVPLTIINLYWTYLMVKKILHLISGHSKAKELDKEFDEKDKNDEDKKNKND